MGSTIETDAYLGKVIYTERAISRMKHHGLYRFHVVETLRFGFDVEPLIPGTRQRVYDYKQEKQVTVVFNTTTKTGKPSGAITVISCWARNVK